MIIFPATIVEPILTVTITRLRDVHAVQTQAIPVTEHTESNVSDMVAPKTLQAIITSIVGDNAVPVGEPGAVDDEMTGLAVEIFDGPNVRLANCIEIGFDGLLMSLALIKTDALKWIEQALDDLLSDTSPGSIELFCSSHVSRSHSIVEP